MSKEKASVPQARRGTFYLQADCCITCGVPQAEAPELVGWTEQKASCYWIRQPETLAEVDKAINVLNSQEVGCHRYSGNDPYILSRVDQEVCDAFTATWAASGPNEDSLFARLKRAIGALRGRRSG